MAGITLAQAEAKLTEYLDAESAVLAGQAYSIAGHSVTRANLAEIRAGISYWESKVKSTEAGGMKVQGIVPIDD